MLPVDETSKFIEKHMVEEAFALGTEKDVDRDKRMLSMIGTRTMITMMTGAHSVVGFKWHVYRDSSWWQSRRMCSPAR